MAKETVIYGAKQTKLQLKVETNKKGARETYNQ